MSFYKVHSGRDEGSACLTFPLGRHKYGSFFSLFRYYGNCIAFNAAFRIGDLHTFGESIDTDDGS